MKAILLAVLTAVLAAGLMAGCVAPGTTSSGTMAGSSYQANQGALGLRAQEDPVSSLGNPFRVAALILHPIGVVLQGMFEAPYVVATAVSPEFFGINEPEQQYLQMRWGVQPPPKPEPQPAAAR